MSLNCSMTWKIQELLKLKHEFNLNNNLHFRWMQLIHSIPQKWKITIKNNKISENLLFLNHHLIKCNILLSLEKLNSKELYLIQLTCDFLKPTSQIYFEQHFNNCVLDSKYIYILPHIVTSDPYTGYFQHKVLNNGLYLKEKLLFLVYQKLPNTLFVTKINKQSSISFATALSQKHYGMV